MNRGAGRLLDVFMVASVKLGALGKITLHVGLYYFGAAVLSMIYRRRADPVT